jgi:hypothetical protein
MDCGNHKSAQKYDAELGVTLEKEVQQGWMFPIPLDYTSKLKHGELAPVGMDDKQWAELPDGSKQVKLRLTHDQSFNTPSGKSVNDRLLTDQLEPLHYGGCLSRLIHYIISIHLRHAKVKIMGGKPDIKAAYRRVTLHGDTAAKCTIMYKGLGLVSSRLTFGGSPCPNEFCIASETLTDLANDILHCRDWDPKELTSPHAPEGRVDDFIDDGIVITPDIGENVQRAIPALLLAFHILFRPVDQNEKIK